MKENYTKKILKMNEIVIVPEVNRIFSFEILEVLGWIGYRCVWIDMEHSKCSLESLSKLTMAARITGMDIILRISKNMSVIRALELGVNGLVLPHCKSEDEVKEFVRVTKFKPLGERGIGGGLDSDYGFADVKKYTKEANEEVLLIAQIEDKEALDDLDGIASTEGIDGLFIGPVDLSSSLNILGKYDDPKIIDVYKKVALACKRNNRFWGLPVADNMDKIFEMQKKGATFFPIQSPITLIYKEYKRFFKEFNLRCEKIKKKSI